MKRSFLAFLVVFGLALTLSVSPAVAVAVLDFETGGAGVGGLVTLLPGPNETGVGIPVNTLTVDGAPIMNGVYDTTGTFGFIGGTAAVLTFDTVANTITVIGGVPGLGIPLGTTLLTGSFAGFSIIQSSNILSLLGWGPDTKDPGLLSAVGIDPTAPFNFFGISISANFDSRTGTGNVISTDFTNSQVPEPGILILLGIGLGAVGVLSRRIKF